MSKKITWTAVRQIASDMGVSRWAIYKWKERGAVPPRWQIAIARRLKCSPDDIVVKDASE